MLGSSLVSRSVDTYASWLKPFVRWLDEELAVKNQPVSSLLIKRYLEDFRDFRTKGCYVRRSKQIVKFVNSAQEHQVQHIDPVHFVVQHDNVNLPDDQEKPINDWLRRRYAKLRAAERTQAVQQEMSKVLGKCHFRFASLTAVFAAAACALVMFTGCRPNEAAWIVVHKTVDQETVTLVHAEFDWMATVPEGSTKTHREYHILLPKSFEFWRTLLMEHTATGYDDRDKLTAALANYWARSVLKGAGVPKEPGSANNYSLKTVRALHGTRYVELYAEYQVMGWTPLPPNPLSHESLKTTKENYAKKGSDNLLKARLRCKKKYGWEPETFAPAEQQ